MGISKTKMIILPFCLGVALISGCKKLAQNDALPVVSIKSVVLTSKDTAIITGTVVNQGAEAIQYEGICYGIDSMPDMLENQHFINSGQTNFTFSVKLKTDSTYFIRVFATNSYGYALSRPASIHVPHQKPPVVPCSLTDMQIIDNGTRYTVDAGYIDPYNTVNYGSWQAEADYGSVQMFFDFWGRPANGAYVTQVDGGQFSTDHSGIEVYVQKTDFNVYSMQSGDSVYVTENPDSSLSLSFCGMHYSIGPSTVSVIGKFTAN